MRFSVCSLELSILTNRTLIVAIQLENDNGIRVYLPIYLFTYSILPFFNSITYSIQFRVCLCLSPGDKHNLRDSITTSYAFSKMGSWRF